MIIRLETPRDVDSIRDITIAAFKDHPFSRQTEHLIVDALREAGALQVSLVAETGGDVVGHIAFSPAVVGDALTGWFLLGPVSVHPDHQGSGVGRALVEAGLEVLRLRRASGCVLVGDPQFYARFGFQQCGDATYPGVPAENVLCLALGDETPSGEIHHHPAFDASPAE